VSYTYGILKCVYSLRHLHSNLKCTRHYLEDMVQAFQSKLENQLPVMSLVVES
jgi:hypothetical protein